MEDLTPKTKLQQSYYEHDYEGFLAVLKKNKKKLTIDPARREPAETLRAEFEGSMGKLMPLRERIERTDGLIDGCAAVRAHGRGDCHRGRQRDNEIEVRAKGLPPSDKSPEKQKSGSMARLTLNRQESRPARR